VNVELNNGKPISMYRLSTAFSVEGSRNLMTTVFNARTACSARKWNGNPNYSIQSISFASVVVFAVMPLDLSLWSEHAKALLKLMSETVQLTRRTTWPIKCHGFRLSNHQTWCCARPI